MHTVTFSIEQFESIIYTVIILCLICGAFSAFFSHLLFPSIAYIIRRVRVWIRYRRSRVVNDSAPQG